MEAVTVTERSVLIKEDGRYDLTMLALYEKDIHKYLFNIRQNYIDIGMRLNDIYCSNSYRVRNYRYKHNDTFWTESCRNIYDYAESMFGFGRTTTKNLMAIYRMFCNPSGCLIDGFENYSYSQLVELLPLTFEGSYSNPNKSYNSTWIKGIKPEMTVKEIREYKKSVITSNIGQTSDQSLNKNKSDNASEKLHVEDMDDIVISDSASNDDDTLYERVELWNLLLTLKDNFIGNSDQKSGFSEAMRICANYIARSCVKFDCFHSNKMLVDYIKAYVVNPYKENSVSYNIYAKAIVDVINLFSGVTNEVSND